MPFFDVAHILLCNFITEVCVQRQSFTVLCSDRACSEQRRSVCLFWSKYVIDITWLILPIFSLPLHHHTGENGESYRIHLSSVEREKPETAFVVLEGEEELHSIMLFLLPRSCLPYLDTLYYVS